MPAGSQCATRRPCNKSLLQDIGLIDVADGVGLLSHRCGQGLDPDWTCHRTCRLSRLVETARASTSSSFNAPRAISLKKARLHGYMRRCVPITPPDARG